ncbi:hypothetical protein, partial [Clostridium sp.]|uniref:hypothetical protein n=1 Tax=Clostridium sp. TaxID=1506 RepID=UPI002847C120
SLKDSKKFYTILKGNYHISIEGSPEIFVRNLPKNVEFIIDDFQDKSSGPLPSPEYRKFTIYRDRGNKCHVNCWCGVEPFAQGLHIKDWYLTLKQDLILKHREVNPNIIDEDSDDFNFSYSMQVKGESVVEVIEAAKKFDSDISDEIIILNFHLLEILRLFLGLITPVDFIKILSTSLIKV